MFLHRLAVLAVLLAGVACTPQKTVYTDDEVPLAAPLELAESGPGGPGLELNDPPGRVVRLNYAAGAVSRQPAGLDEWAPAGVNQPLATGDSLWVPPEGMAELHAGATDLRLDQNTGLDVLRLDNHALQLGLSRGSVAVRILGGRDADSVEVDTPSGAVLLSRAGSYRVDADPDGGTGQVTVRAGTAEVTAAGLTVPVNSGSTLQLSGGDTPRYDVVAAKAPDRFDQWCDQRDQREDRSESATYTGRGMVGYEDLDGQGTWQVTPEYGSAWAPRVPAGWAPYRNGRWAWADPWGWTWVDDAPWGFATSHYGRWANRNGAWLWLPWADGMRQAPPVYAPALVAFAGGPGFRGPGRPEGGAVAWFPLGPREPYLPAYPASPAYLRGVNAPNLPPGAVATMAAPVHANQTVPGAMTAVPQGVFTGARPVAPAALALRGTLQPQDWKVGSAPALAPRRESLLASAPGAPPATQPPAADRNRPLMARRLPVAAVAFEARRQALAERQGRPLAAPALAGLRAQQPPGRGVPYRLATAFTPGRTLAPARPGLVTGRPAGARMVLPPVSRPQPQPRGSIQDVSPAPGQRGQPPRGLPQGGQPQRVMPQGGPGMRSPQAQGLQGEPERNPALSGPGREGGLPPRFKGQAGGAPVRRAPARPQGGRGGGGRTRREVPKG